MSPYSADKRTVVGGISKFLADHRRNNVIAQDVPGRFPCLVTVEGTFSRCDLSPAGRTAVAHINQDDVPLFRQAEACFKGIEQPHEQFAYFNPLDKHAKLRERKHIRSTLPSVRIRR